MKIPTGIVLYNPDLERLKENIESIYDGSSDVFLVDNGSSNILNIEELLKNYDKCFLIKRKTNEGIASALNILCQTAINNGYEYILTLDQDSVCPDNIFIEYKNNMGNNQVGIICPEVVDRNSNKKIDSDKSEEVDKCITSASLVLLKAWQDVNGFDETMFIDGVDFDFCYRIRKKGYKIIKLHTVVLLHELGHIKVKRFLFWEISIFNHSAFRKYYIARNIVFLARKKRKKSLVIRADLQVIKQIILVLLYEDNKKEKIRSIKNGYLEGKKALINSKWS